MLSRNRASVSRIAINRDWIDSSLPVALYQTRFQPLERFHEKRTQAKPKINRFKVEKRNAENGGLMFDNTKMTSEDKL